MTVIPGPIVVHPIGLVERDAADVGLSGDDLRARPCRIRLDPALRDGLLGVEPGSDILVLFWCHQVTDYRLQLHPRGDDSRPLRGVFATHSQYRPNPIAVTIAHVLRVEGELIEVAGLDAFDGSPVLDIKNVNG